MNETHPKPNKPLTGIQARKEVKQGYFVHYYDQAPADAVNLLKGMQSAFKLVEHSQTVALIPSAGSDALQQRFDVVVIGTRKNTIDIGALRGY